MIMKAHLKNKYSFQFLLLDRRKRNLLYRGKNIDLHYRLTSLENSINKSFLIISYARNDGNNNDSLFVTKGIKISQVSQHSFYFKLTKSGKNLLTFYWIIRHNLI